MLRRRVIAGRLMQQGLVLPSITLAGGFPLTGDAKSLLRGTWFDWEQEQQ